MELPFILIVDDHKEQLVATQTTVFVASNKIGKRYETKTAENLEDARSFFGENQNLPCLVILDMHLPKKKSGLDREFSEYAGYELLREMTEKHPHIWWLIVSGQPHLNQIMVEDEGKPLLSAINSHSNVIGIWFKTREDDLLRILEQFLLFESQDQRKPSEKNRIPGSVREEINDEYFIATSSISLNIYNKIWMLASGARSVLAIGEKGSGKELVSKLLHKIANKEEKFGKNEIYKKISGETVDYDTLMGTLSQVNTGTLYIENIDKMPKSLQDDLTRNLIALENFHSRVVFSVTRHHTNFTPSIVSTDVYLNSIILPIPSLREKLDEIGDLAENFLRQYNMRSKNNKKFVQMDKLEQVLKSCIWENNLDDLRLVVEQAAIMTSSPAIGLQEITDAANQRKVLKD